MKKRKTLPPHSNNPGCIYVIAATNGLVKVGISTTPKDRFHSIKGASPLALSLVHTCEVKARAQRLEYEIHQRMMAVHSHGEWFRASAADAIRIVEEIAGPWRREPLAAVEPAAADWKRRNADRIDAGKRRARQF